MGCTTKLNLIWNPMKHMIRTTTNYCPNVLRTLIMDLPKTQCSQLHNNLVVATEERDSNVACIGLYVCAGSRYESPVQNGIAHLFEHLVYKGTKSHAKVELESLMAKTGAKFKCWTSRELCAYYAECLPEDISIVTKILFQSVYENAFNPAEIGIQKEIIYQEMLEQDQSAQSLMMDYLFSTAFQGTPLGQSVMGLSNNLFKFQADHISHYVYQHFIPQRTILAAVGNVKHEQLVSVGETYFKKSESQDQIPQGPCRYTGSEIKYRDDTLVNAHVAVAVEGPQYCSRDRLVMQLAALVLGAWDKSQPGGTDHYYRAARAASSGLAQCYEPFHYFFKDVGLWGVQYISPKLEAEDMLLVIQDEWMRLCNVITDSELIGPKNEMKSKILNKIQKVTKTCHEIGEMVMYLGCRPTIEERFAEIDSINADEMREVCSKYLYDKCPAVVGIGAIECVPDYTRTRAGMDIQWDFDAKFCLEADLIEMDPIYIADYSKLRCGYRPCLFQTIRREYICNRI